MTFSRALVFLFMPLGALAQVPATPAVPLQTGVSAALAAQRAHALRHVSYTLQFALPGAPTEAVAANETLRFELRTALPDSLALDFNAPAGAVQRLAVNGQVVAPVQRSEHVLIAPRYLRPGANTLEISFTAGNRSLNRNPEFVYTLLVPDRARTVFPCFDQPDLKATFALSLTLPTAWRAVANGPLADSSAHAAAGMKTYRFGLSDTISTYLFAFAAGKFRHLTQQADGRPMHFYYRETDTAKLGRSLGPIFAIQAGALKFLQEYTQRPYPFQKFDFVGVPDFQYGGMEHPGVIDYKAASLFLDAGATREQLNGRANLLAHETAHMWFGDLVTMRWFDDVWTKEVFANFMADKISTVTQPDGNFDLKFLTDHYPAAYAVDRSAGANPIRQPLDNLKNAGSLYGNIIYHKAPIMMRQLERLMGPDAFRAGLREYLRRYAYGNATWPDLIALLDARTPADLQAWNRVWVNEPGRPKFSYRLRVAGGRIQELTLDQQGEDGSHRVWPQAFTVALVYADRVDELPVDMLGAHLRLRAAEGRPTPKYVLINALGDGYGLFPLDAQALPHLGELKNPVMRAAAYINLSENLLAGQAGAPAQVLARLRPLLAHEPEELNLGLLLDQVASIFWRFTPPEQRPALAATLEPELWAAMQQVGPPNLKKLLFKAYAGLATSHEAQDRLYNSWQTRQPPAGIVLTEDDYTDLAGALAVRAYPGYADILQTQLGRIQNPDRRQRLQYLLPALSDDAGVRDAFFASLSNAKNREKEAWVAAALAYLHHPLRVGYSEKYLPQSLALVEELQRTGDIFFPQTWLQATLRWYRTPTAAATVRQFLQARPNYPAPLRAKIEQSADNLYRAAKL